MYGWRARIGILYPSAGICEPELNLFAQDGISLHTTRLSLKRGSLEEIKKLGEKVVEGAQLLADARVDLIAFNCTAGSLSEGKGYDAKIIKTIECETGIKATTTATAVIEALQALNIKRIILITPYKEEINKLEINFLKEHGFEVVASQGLGIDEPYQQALIDPRQWYTLARKLQETDGEVYFISCAGIRVVEVISSIEDDTRLPVVTSNQALMWHCLKLMKIKSEIKNYGILFNIN